MNSEELYLLKIIDDLTWHQYNPDYGPEKTTSFELEGMTGFDKVKIRILLNNLKTKKLISNARDFQGAKAGWFSTAKGNALASYTKYKKE